MAQLSHAKPGVIVYSGSWTGGATPTIVAGAGSFTVSFNADLYTVTLLGPEPIATKMVICLSVEDTAMTGASDAFILNVKDTTPQTGVFTVQAREVSGTVDQLEDAAVVHFVVYAHVATDSVA